MYGFVGVLILGYDDLKIGIINKDHIKSQLSFSLGDIVPYIESEDKCEVVIDSDLYPIPTSIVEEIGYEMALEHVGGKAMITC